MLTFLHPGRRHRHPTTRPTPIGGPAATIRATATTAPVIAVFAATSTFVERLADELAPAWRVVAGPALGAADPAIVVVDGFDAAVIDRLGERYRHAAVAVVLPAAHRASDIVDLYDLDVDHVITSASPTIVASHLRALARRVAWADGAGAPVVDGGRLAG